MPHALTYIYSSSHNTMGGKKREQWKQKWRDRHLMLFPLKCVKYKLPVSFLMNDLPLWCFKKLFNWHVRISTKFFLVCNLFSIPSVQGASAFLPSNIWIYTYPWQRNDNLGATIWNSSSNVNNKLISPPSYQHVN
jgi:hypothetical protein